MISIGIFNITIDALTLVTLGIVALPFILLKGKFDRTYYNFMWGTVAAFVVCSAEIIKEMCYIESFSRHICGAAITASYCFTFLSILFYTEYQFLAIKLPVKTEKTIITALSVLCTIASILTVLFAVTGVFRPYQKLVLFIAEIIGLLTDCLVVLMFRKAPAKQRLSFALFALVMTAGLFVSYFYPSTPATQIGFLIAVCLLYINSFIENNDELRKREAELTNSKMEVMISQIQPHFLYNSLSAAASLCHTDPDKAEETINNFGRYLRGNLDSLRRNEPVPFSQELRHIKAYAELEKTRLQGQLEVEYNIGISDFTLPALSVQPLVENAVKHGIAESGNAGKVTVSTREDSACYYVEVRDDGQGFDKMLLRQDSGTHIGIENVRSRLEKMVGGRLEIVSAPGSGTTATVIIPKKRA